MEQQQNTIPQDAIVLQKEIYFELFRTYKKRIKTKHLTKEAFLFERESAKVLARDAHALYERTWDVHGYFPFQVYHPSRQINAPMYPDRVVEQWFVEKYIQPVFAPRLFPHNMACQPGKGPLLTMDTVKAALEEMYYMYGTNWYVFQYDMQGYFDNISHAAAKMAMKEIGEEGCWIFDKITDSFCVDDGYAALDDPAGEYGFPKGNLPSQWTGVILLDELDWAIHNDPDCIFNIRYMDDGLNFFPTLAAANRCRAQTEEYLKEKGLGIRLHPKKTYCAPIPRGFTFCGWRYTLDPDGKIHVRIKNEKKKDMERRLRVISERVRAGKMPLTQANVIRRGMFHHLSHGTESARLIRYLKHQYPFPELPQGGGD